jgi:hypothetical protein
LWVHAPLLRIYLADSVVFLFCLVGRCSYGMKMRLGRCRSTG